MSRLWYVYVLQNAKRPRQVYTGATNRPAHRLRAHRGQVRGGARTTARWGPGAARMVMLVGPFAEVESASSKVQALSFERLLKRQRSPRPGLEGRMHACCRLLGQRMSAGTGRLGRHVQASQQTPLCISTSLKRPRAVRMAGDAGMECVYAHPCLEIRFECILPPAGP